MPCEDLDRSYAEEVAIDSFNRRIVIDYMMG
jgi:hypothetical protein